MVTLINTYQQVPSHEHDIATDEKVSKHLWNIYCIKSLFCNSCQLTVITSPPPKLRHFREFHFLDLLGSRHKKLYSFLHHHWFVDQLHNINLEFAWVRGWSDPFCSHPTLVLGQVGMFMQSCWVIYRWRIKMDPMLF